MSIDNILTISFSQDLDVDNCNKDMIKLKGLRLQMERNQEYEDYLQDRHISKYRDLSIDDWNVTEINGNFIQVLVRFTTAEDISSGGIDYQDSISVRVFEGEHLKFVKT